MTATDALPPLYRSECVPEDLLELELDHGPAAAPPRPEAAAPVLRLALPLAATLLGLWASLA